MEQAERALRVCRHGMNPFKSLTKEERKALQKVDPEVCAFQSDPWSPRAITWTGTAKGMSNNHWADVYAGAGALAGCEQLNDSDSDGDDEHYEDSRAVLLL